MQRDRFGLLVLFGLAALLMLALPAAAGAAAWGPEFSVSGPPPEESGPWGPSVLMDAQGNATYVWSQYDDNSGTSVLRSRVYGADETVGQIEDIPAAPEAGSVRDVQAAIDGSGVVRVAWVQEQFSCTPSCGLAYQLKNVALGPDGTPIGEPQTIDAWSDDELGLSALSYAVNSAGEGAIGLLAHDGSGDEVLAYSVSPQGVATDVSPSGEAEELGGYISVAIGDAGSVFAAWSGYDGSLHRSVEAAMLGGSSAVAHDLDPAETFLGVGGLAALIDGEGNGTVVFSAQASPLSSDVYTSRLNADLSSEGPTPISDEESVESASFWADGAALAPDGSVLVGWSEDTDAFTTLISPSGSVGAAVALTPGEAVGWAPHLALTPAGDGVALFESATEFESSEETPRLDQLPLASDGKPTGQATTVATISDPEFEYFELESTHVALSANGNGAASWVVEDEEGESAELLGSLRDGVAPAVSLWVPAKALVGEPTVMGASGEDIHPISYSWSFGDGSSGTGAVASHVYAAPGAYSVSVTATDSAGNSVTRMGSIQAVAAGTPGAAVVRPETMVLKAPPRKTRKRQVKVRFVSSQAGSKFECALDAGGWKPCRSPLKLKGLAPGSHELRIRAINAAGEIESDGPVVRFRVLKPKRRD
jgi:hypothetical protein